MVSQEPQGLFSSFPNLPPVVRGACAQGFTEEGWPQPDNTRPPQQFLRDLTPEWQWRNALRSGYARRMELVEIDVLVAQEPGLTLEEPQLNREEDYRIAWAFFGGGKVKR